MEYRLDRRLNLITEPEYKSLYHWAIKEVDEDGNSIGRDQIPWSWTLHFSAASYSVTDSISVSNRSFLGVDKLEKPEVTETKSIRINLKPGSKGDDARKYEEVSYSMFGTNRGIEDFQLILHRLDDDAKSEVCTASGSISYVTEVDFRSSLQKDYLCFDFQIKPSTFDRYNQLASQGLISGAIFSVGFVSGFYSEWSPSISTTSVKILADAHDQELLIPAGFPHQVRTLGEVGKASFVLYNKNSLEVKNIIPSSEEEIDPEISQYLPQPPIANYQTNAEILAILNKIKNLIWLLIFALTIILSSIVW